MVNASSAGAGSSSVEELSMGVASFIVSELSSPPDEQAIKNKTNPKKRKLLFIIHEFKGLDAKKLRQGQSL